MAVQLSDKLTVKARLRGSGSSETFVAHDEKLDRDVLVQVFPLGPGPNPEQQFKQAAQTIAGLRHPNIARIYQFDVQDGRPFITREFLSGGSLQERMGNGPQSERIPLTQVAHILKSVGAALDYAHRRGVVHSNLKPSNILFSTSGEPVLADFAIGNAAANADYQSPEQAAGQPLTPRSDIYSLGVILYQVVTGQLPRENQAPSRVVPGLPASLDDAILRALSPRPEDRFASAGELARAFDAAVPESTAQSADDAPTIIARKPAPVPAPEALSVARQTSGPSPRPVQSAAPKGIQPTAAVASQSLTGSSRSRTRMPLLILGLLTLVLLLAVGIFLTIGSGLFQAKTTDQGLASMPGMGATVEKSFGLLRFTDGAARMDQAVFSVNGMPSAGAGKHYEAWLSGDGETPLNIGKLQIDSKGQAQLTFLSKDGKNLLDQFDRVLVSAQPDTDPGTFSAGTVVYSSVMPPGALMHIRHLLVGFDDTPNHIGLAIGLLQDGKLVRDITRDLQDAQQKSDFERVLIDSEILVNTIEGKKGQHYGDLDRNGVVSDPSDGYGLLLNGQHLGYIEGTIDHANLAAASPDATAEIKSHADHVKVSAKNLSDWAIKLRDLGLSILASKDNAASADAVKQAYVLGDRFLNGVDLDGDEHVDPVPGEGGVLTVYEHSSFLTNMPLLQGASAMPKP